MVAILSSLNFILFSFALQMFTPLSTCEMQTDEAFLDDAQATSAKDIGDISFAEAVRAAVVGSGAVPKNKLYACSPPSGASVVRLSQPRKCHKHSESTNMTEGIAVVFKQNISPLVFNATLYYKHITTVTTWRGLGLAQITNEFRTRVNIAFEEIRNDIDGRGECVTRAVYNRNKAVYEAYDNDEHGVYRPLVPTLVRSPVSRSFHTTNITQRHTRLGYRTSTTVDCVVEYLQARSVYPYVYFGLATGNTIEMSPFYNSNDGKRRYNIYADDRVYEALNYQARDLGTGVMSQPKNRIFLFEDEYTIAWDQMEEKKSTCTLKKWLVVPEAIRVSYPQSFHFTFKDFTATLVSAKNQFNISRLHLAECVPKEARQIIDGIYEAQYKSSHVKSGEIEYYLGKGGFLIAFQKLLSNNLAELYLDEARRQNHSAVRHRREVPSGSGIVSGPNGELINTHTSATFSMLQFSYDRIQAHVNTLIGNLLEAWCEMQNRQLVMWHEMKKLNPSSLLSSLFGHVVSARLLGDVLAVSKCIEIPLENIGMQDSMRIPGDPSMCYVRPICLFRYPASTSNDATGNVSTFAAQHNLDIQGQLGEHNEILQSRELIEPCKVNHRRYFLFGENYLLYENYMFVRQVNASEIEEVNTYIDLNATLLEDLDFVPLAVYTREELRDVGTLNYDEVVRYNNMYNKMFRDLDTAIRFDDGLATLKAIGEFLASSLGEVGKVLGTVVMGGAAAIISTVSGIASFLSNPFAALGIGIAVVVCIILGLIAFKYVMNLRSNPIQALFPGITTVSQTTSQTRNRFDNSDEADKELAERVLNGLELLTAERHASKAKKATFISKVSKFLRNRRSTAKEDKRRLLDEEDYYYYD
ncbi:Envelope glycoprotein B [Cacatuid alphaherpesvirus 2]|uniref:Envelope glycoprotein B n=1 Tax=Cacatuid alphaherpesvirus 2 TaxID=2604840 RepID=A0A5B9RBA6_9ALPH|nr:Envelope glycoprotein B [Cacatuid alphaherpesvirus 2]QEG54045.1 Envelope glycoprotein B [Cacatuid alphaherpesvirus 2]